MITARIREAFHADGWEVAFFARLQGTKHIFLPKPGEGGNYPGWQMVPINEAEQLKPLASDRRIGLEGGPLFLPHGFLEALIEAHQADQPAPIADAVTDARKVRDQLLEVVVDTARNQTSLAAAQLEAFQGGEKR